MGLIWYNNNKYRNDKNGKTIKVSLKGLQK